MSFKSQKDVKSHWTELQIFQISGTGTWKTDDVKYRKNEIVGSKLSEMYCKIIHEYTKLRMKHFTRNTLSISWFMV